MESHQEGSLKLKCFSPLQNIDFPFYLRGLLELFFVFPFPSFLFFSVLFFMLRLLRTWGFFMIFEKKITSSKTSFQMA
jgi:hypothetical protein